MSREALLFGEELCLTFYSVKANNTFESVIQMQTRATSLLGIPIDSGKQTYFNRPTCNTKDTRMMVLVVFFRIFEIKCFCFVYVITDQVYDLEAMHGLC